MDQAQGGEHFNSGEGGFFADQSEWFINQIQNRTQHLFGFGAPQSQRGDKTEQSRAGAGCEWVVIKLWLMSIIWTPPPSHPAPRPARPPCSSLVPPPDSSGCGSWWLTMQELNQYVCSRAANKGSRIFHNHGEGPYYGLLPLSYLWH